MSRSRWWAGRAWLAVRGEQRILAGIMDAGLSSLATFVVGLAATRSLEPSSLGGYALAFSVFVLSAYVPAQLVFTPVEIAAVNYPAGRQIPLLRQSLARGSAVSLAAATVTSGWFLVAPAGIPGDGLVAFVVTCAAATLVSPLQDHVRRMLHLAGASWRAVAVAIVQIVAVPVTILGLEGAGIRAEAIPFGSLALANVLSLAFGLALSARDLTGPPARHLGSELRRSGGPLLVVGLVPSATTFVVSWLIGTIAGGATLGYAEAARIASQPVAVLQQGLSNVLGPRATRAASRRDRDSGRLVGRLFVAIVVFAGSAWVLAVGVTAPWNLLAGAIPTAYVVGGLVAASTVAFTIQSLALGRRFEVYGAGRESLAARTEVEGNAARIAVALLAGVIGPFVAPLGHAMLGGWRLYRYGRVLDEHYGRSVGGTVVGEADADPDPRDPGPPAAVRPTRDGGR